MKPFLFVLFLLLSSIRTDAQVLELIKLVTTKVIKAIDLKIQQLQNEAIALQVAQKDIENKMNRNRLSEIRDWQQKQKDLYADYFKELSTVKASIRTYKRVTEIIKNQKELFATYQQGWATVSLDIHFTSLELDAISIWYTEIIDKSIVLTEQLSVLVNDGQVRTTDATRLDVIDQYAEELKRLQTRLLKFNQQLTQVKALKTQGIKDNKKIKQLFGL